MNDPILNPTPSKAKLAFLDSELGIFFHFGVRTFNEENRDWDMLPMKAESFNPTALDCRQWIRSIRDAGAKYAVMTTKHHDGFALWPSKYTEFSVKNAPWKGGEGDVVREFVEACREFGVKVGLYYSCAQFGSKEMGDAQYNDFVDGQLHELFTGYGPLDEIWFDSCGSEGHNFDVERIEKTIRTLQPDALVFGGWAQDIRWIGNEWGYAPLFNRDTATRNGEPVFLPGECDCCMTRFGSENFWFYNETHRDCLRTVDELVGMYYLSVGRGSNLLLNIAPDRRGLLPDEPLALLNGMTAELRRRFTERRLETSPVEKVVDSGRAEYRVELEKNQLVDQLVLSEDLSSGGHIRAFTVYASPHRTDGRIAVYRGETIGHKHICTFPTIRAKLIDVVVDESDGCENVVDIGALYVGDGSGRQVRG